MSNSTPGSLGLVAHYTLLESLAPAGPGELYRARDLRRGGTVALRLLPAEPDVSARERLVSQVRELAGLSHPNITAVLDVGEHEERVYVVFEFLSGHSLRDGAGGRPLHLRRAVEVAIQIADAVAHAHAAGFAHRGLSPETVVITSNGQAKIPTCELATRHGFDPTREPARLRDYVSPEEERGETPDDRSDVYSVGAILYEMLTARKPPPRGAAAPSAWNAGVSRALDRLTLKAVAPNPDFRHQRAAELASELRGLAGRLDQPDVTQPKAEPPRRSSTGSGLALLAGVVILAVVAIVWWAINR
jgi:serine/threonine protein kinase